MPERLDARAMALLVVLCATWGLAQTAIKVANTGVSPLLQAALRSAGSAALVLGWSALRGVRVVQRDGTLAYGATVAVLFAAEFVFLYWGLTLTTASRAVLFIYTAPFVVAIGGHAMLPGERLTALKVAGLLCAFAGLVLAFVDALYLPNRRQLAGDLMEVTAAILWGATTLVIKAKGARVSPHKTLFYQLGGSALILGALSLAVGERGVTRLDGPVLASLFFQIVVVAFVTYLAWTWLLWRYPASHLASFSFLTPLFGALAGWLLLGERVTPALVAALTLVAGGIYLVNAGALRRA